MIACIDIGGTSMKVGLINESGQLSNTGKLPVSPDNFAEIKLTILEWVMEMKKSFDITGLAFSCPGAVNSETGIIGGASAVPCIHGPNFKEEFKVLDLPVELENDANCAALAEVYSGAAKDEKDVCFVVIGSGIGGCVIKDGKVHHGKHLFGGEFGYILVDDRDDLKILSELASTQALVRNVKERIPVEWDGLSVFEAADTGNEICQEEVQKFYHYLAMGIYNIQYIYDPSLIVLGGAVSNRSDLCERIDEEIEKLREKVRIASIKPKLVTCQYTGDANLIGAYVNFINHQ